MREAGFHFEIGKSGRGASFFLVRLPMPNAMCRDATVPVKRRMTSARLPVTMCAVGRVVKLADTQDLGSCGETRAGSSPASPTSIGMCGQEKMIAREGFMRERLVRAFLPDGSSSSSRSSMKDDRERRCVDTVAYPRTFFTNRFIRSMASLMRLMSVA